MYLFLISRSTLEEVVETGRNECANERRFVCFSGGKSAKRARDNPQDAHLTPDRRETAENGQFNTGKEEVIEGAITEQLSAKRGRVKKGERKKIEKR